MDEQPLQNPVSTRHGRDKSHIQLTYITHFYCNQSDINALIDKLRLYESYPAELLDVIEFVIVDDCSPIEYDIPQFDLNITWLRIDDDITWNQGGARNLGVTYAKSDKIIMTDLDHYFPLETLQHMVDRPAPGRNFYKVYRSDHDTGMLRKGHSNIFFMSRARFMRLYGYDEEFCGHYGAEDYRFVKFQKYHGSRQLYLPKGFRCFERRDLYIKNCPSYHNLERDLSFNTPVDARKKLEVETYGPEAGHSRLFLQFRWHLHAVFQRSHVPIRQRRPLWKHLWYLRWIISSLAK